MDTAGLCGQIRVGSSAHGHETVDAGWAWAGVLKKWAFVGAHTFSLREWAGHGQKYVGTGREWT